MVDQNRNGTEPDLSNEKRAIKIAAYSLIAILLFFSFRMVVDLTDGKTRIKVLSGVLRYSSSADTWELIQDSSHKPLNIKSVSVEPNRINIFYGFTAKKVLSLIAMPDETYVARGLMAGTSVGRSSASIYLQQVQTIGGEVGFSETDGWRVPKGYAASFKNGILTVRHPEMGEGAQVSVTSKSEWRVSAPSATGKYVQLSWYDAKGALQTEPSPLMQAYITRTRDSSSYVDPMILQSNNGNIWVLGVFEI